MIIIPAIDIIKGRAVRLYQGDFDKREVVGSDPVALALEFQDVDVKILHVVDLDGARDGQPQNFDVIKKIIKSVSVSVEVGGGIRTRNDIKEYLDAGILRVILGSKAVSDLDFIKDICQEYGEKIVIGVDSRDGLVMTDGWLKKSQVETLEFLKTLEGVGVRRIIFTDISRDGTLTEPNYEMLEQIVNQVDIPVIASGGVRDLTQLYRLDKIGVEGVIVGKALYSGTVDLKEAVAKLN